MEPKVSSLKIFPIVIIQIRMVQEKHKSYVNEIKMKSILNFENTVNILNIARVFKREYFELPEMVTILIKSDLYYSLLHFIGYVNPCDF